VVPPKLESQKETSLICIPLVCGYRYFSIKFLEKKERVKVYVFVPPEMEIFLEEYRDKFGEDYPIAYIPVTSGRIRECIETNTPVPLSEYEDMIGMSM
jgi:hypothetical protein